MCVYGLSLCIGISGSVLDVDVRCYIVYYILYYIIYYYIIYYTYTIILITIIILYSSPLLFYSPILFLFSLLSSFLPFLFLLSSPLPNLPFHHTPIIPDLIQSIRVGIWISLLIFYLILIPIIFFPFFFLPSSVRFYSLPLFQSQSSSSHLLLNIPIPSHLLFYSSLPLQSSPLPLLSLIHSIRVGLYCWVLISSSLLNIPNQTIRPRMFYRSGWLRCDVVISVVFWFELV